jgi:hypothetical protein
MCCVEELGRVWIKIGIKIGQQVVATLPNGILVRF